MRTTAGKLTVRIPTNELAEWILDTIESPFTYDLVSMAPRGGSPPEALEVEFTLKPDTAESFEEAFEAPE